jgi:hypothetical protein
MLDPNTVIERLRAMDGTAQEQGGGFFGEAAGVIEALVTKCDNLLIELTGYAEPLGQIQAQAMLGQPIELCGRRYVVEAVPPDAPMGGAR